MNLWKISIYAKRIVCLFRGCQEGRESGWNMPDDWHSPVYCKRCGACDDVYDYESTPYRILYSGDTFVNKLRNFRV